MNYVVRDGEAVIVDEFTGRVMAGAAGATASTRRSAKESPDSGRDPGPGLDHLQELFPALSTLGGDDRYYKDGRVEFEKTYKLETTIVPTNRVRARQD